MSKRQFHAFLRGYAATMLAAAAIVLFRHCHISLTVPFPPSP